MKFEKTRFCVSSDVFIVIFTVQIVNYLDEAPFLVHIYPPEGGEEGSQPTNKKNKLVKEKAVPESWALIKERWSGGSSPVPNGIILVEEMKCSSSSSSDGDCPYKECLMNNLIRDMTATTKVWGILIQGKGANYPACYLLKTSRVSCVSGFCTHFCLVRVECFAEHLDMQFKKLWLL